MLDKFFGWMNKIESYLLVTGTMLLILNWIDVYLNGTTSDAVGAAFDTVLWGWLIWTWQVFWRAEESGEDEEEEPKQN